MLAVTIPDRPLEGLWHDGARRRPAGQGKPQQEVSRRRVPLDDAFDSALPVAVGGVTEAALASLEPTATALLADVLQRYGDVG